MNYYIFVDESGSFDEAIPGGENMRSLVGGICSKLGSSEWASHHQRMVQRFNDLHNTEFEYPENFHASPMMAGRVRVEGAAGNSIIREFVKTAGEEMFQSCSFLFASINTPRRFEYSPQATYGLNLVAGLKEALDQLAGLNETVTRCFINVAQRTIDEITSRPRIYMPELLKFVRVQLEAGDSPGAMLARRLTNENSLILDYGVGTKDAGLIAADFACSAIRHNTNLPHNLFKTHPDESHVTDFDAFYRTEIKRLLDAQQYAAAAGFLHRYLPSKNRALELESVIVKLKEEKNARVLKRELPALAVHAEVLIDSRTQSPAALTSARFLLESLERLSQEVFDENPDPKVQRQWVDLHLYVLMLLVCCHNHAGETGPQEQIEEQINKFLRDPDVRGSKTFIERQEFLLETKVRAVNGLFNDYNFKAVLDAIEPELEKRKNSLPEHEKDELLGQLQGTAGQGWAFMAHSDLELSTFSRDYFEASLSHFTPGTQYHAMSVNFLATLAWQEGNLPLACTEMARHPEMPDQLSVQTITDDFSKLMTGLLSPFDAVNICRIVASSIRTAEDDEVVSTVSVWKYWQPKMVDAHPYEQLCKWLGFIALHQKDYSSAMTFFDRGIKICDTLDFTLNTIQLPVLGLMAITAKAAGNHRVYHQYLNDFTDSINNLPEKSEFFASVITNRGGRDQLVHAINKGDMDSAWKIARMLPFSYS